MRANITLEPIGVVESEFKKPKDLHFACRDGKHAQTISRIIINDEFSSAISGIDEFSHLWILFILDKADRIELTTYPGPADVKGLPKKGVFATRSQYRPNHIALRLVEFVKLEGNVLTVKGLDAIYGSKVIDIKPFVSHFDLPGNFREPEWYKWE